MEKKQYPYKKLSPDDVVEIEKSGKFITAVYNKPTRETPLGLKWDIVGDSIVLVRVTDNGLAASQHPYKLRKGMKLVSVNGIDFSSKEKKDAFHDEETGVGVVVVTKQTLADAANVIKNAEGMVTFVVAKPVSIKDSDRYTGTERVKNCVFGLLVTVLGAFLTLAVFEIGFIASPTLIVLVVGLILMCQACCAEYKDKIKIVAVKDWGCPECMGGPVEMYKEPIENTFHWADPDSRIQEYGVTKVHCMACGYKNELDIGSDGGATGTTNGLVHNNIVKKQNNDDTVSTLMIMNGTNEMELAALRNIV